MAEQNKKPRRHPEFAIPKGYDLKLKADYPAGIFTGAVKISVSVVSDTKLVALDAVGLSVNPKSVSFASENKVLGAVRVELLKKEQAVVLEFKESLPIGYGFLSMEFEGTLNCRIKGFLRSIFKHSGEKKIMVETESMPAAARWCFPCWGEPHCKATLKITSEVVGWEERGSVWLRIVVALVVAFLGIARPPGGYWRERSSDHPERVGYDATVYLRPEAFQQFCVFYYVGFYAGMGAWMVQLYWWWGVRGRLWARLVLLWICISAAILSCLVVLFDNFDFDMRPMVSFLVWLGIVALGLYVRHKQGYVEEKARVYYEEEGMV